MKNLDGQWVVTKSGDPGGFVTADIPAVVTSSLKDTFPGGATNTNYTGDWSGVNLFNKAGDKVWPICAFTYMHIRRSYTAHQTGGWGGGRRRGGGGRAARAGVGLARLGATGDKARN